MNVSWHHIRFVKGIHWMWIVLILMEPVSILTVSWQQNGTCGNCFHCRDIVLIPGECLLLPVSLQQKELVKGIHWWNGTYSHGECVFSSVLAAEGACEGHPLHGIVLILMLSVLLPVSWQQKDCEGRPLCGRDCGECLDLPVEGACEIHWWNSVYSQVSVFSSCPGSQKNLWRASTAWNSAYSHGECLLVSGLWRASTACVDSQYECLSVLAAEGACEGHPLHGIVLFSWWVSCPSSVQQKKLLKGCIKHGIVLILMVSVFFFQCPGSRRSLWRASTAWSAYSHGEFQCYGLGRACNRCLFSWWVSSSSSVLAAEGACEGRPLHGIVLISWWVLVLPVRQQLWRASTAWNRILMVVSSSSIVLAAEGACEGHPLHGIVLILMVSVFFFQCPGSRRNLWRASTAWNSAYSHGECLLLPVSWQQKELVKGIHCME